MERYKVTFLQEALGDLEEIVLYIAQDSPSAALKLHDTIIEKAQSLTTFPKRGRLIADKKMSEAGYRLLVAKPYLLFYRVLGSEVFIYRVVHGATDYPLLYERMVESEIHKS